MTVRREPEELRSFSLELALDLLACGLELVVENSVRFGVPLARARRRGWRQTSDVEDVASNLGRRRLRQRDVACHVGVDRAREHR